jgi:hypothetical protein
MVALLKGVTVVPLALGVSGGGVDGAGVGAGVGGGVTCDVPPARYSSR